MVGERGKRKKFLSGPFTLQLRYQLKRQSQQIFQTCKLFEFGSNRKSFAGLENIVKLSFKKVVLQLTAHNLKSAYKSKVTHITIRSQLSTIMPTCCVYFLLALILMIKLAAVFQLRSRLSFTAAVLSLSVGERKQFFFISK